MSFNSTFSALSNRGWSSSAFEGWYQLQQLSASDALNQDNFGFSVSYSADGNYAVVGARAEDTAPYSANGAAYVYYKTGGIWIEQAKLLASDLATNDLFGSSVSINELGDTIAIGASNASDGVDRSGAVYIFTRSGTTWTQQQKFFASTTAASDEFGGAVSISNSGNYLAVGAAGYLTTGATYIFIRSGTTWTQQARFTGSGVTAGSRSGTSVCISGDANYVAFGDPNDGTTDLGCTYVFIRSGTTWTQQAKLNGVPIGSGTGFNYGLSTCINYDGSSLMQVNQNGRPIILCYTRSGSTWTLLQSIDLGPQSITTNLSTRFALSCNANANTFIYGLWLAGNANKIYIFNKNTTYNLFQVANAINLPSDADFGYSVSLSQNTDAFIVGAPQLSVVTPNTGLGFIFVKDA
jgi:hypothetical protein